MRSDHPSRLPTGYLRGCPPSCHCEAQGRVIVMAIEPEERNMYSHKDKLTIESPAASIVLRGSHLAMLSFGGGEMTQHSS